MLTVIEFGLPVSETSTGSQKYMCTTDYEHKFHETGIEN